MVVESRTRKRKKRSGVDPDPVTGIGDGTTKSNPPSKIESCLGFSVLNERGRAEAEEDSFKIKRFDHVGGKNGKWNRQESTEKGETENK